MPRLLILGMHNRVFVGIRRNNLEIKVQFNQGTMFYYQTNLIINELDLGYVQIFQQTKVQVMQTDCVII